MIMVFLSITGHLGGTMIIGIITIAHHRRDRQAALPNRQAVHQGRRRYLQEDNGLIVLPWFDIKKSEIVNFSRTAINGLLHNS